MHIAISRLHFPITALGPGRRVGIWFQGCSIRCAGCISADTWSYARGGTTVEELALHLEPWLHEADGVTISGGEPFDQPEALLALIGALRLEGRHDVLIYSGHPFERLQTSAVLRTGRVDALICDPYIDTVPQTLPLRGSNNQRLFLLTPRGCARFACYEQVAGNADRAIDLMFDDDGTVWLAGIPRQRDMQRLRELLESQGHRITTSDAKPDERRNDSLLP